jgi:hypothetical protein
LGDNIRDNFSAMILQENLIGVLLQMVPKSLNNPDLIQQICFALGNLLSMNDFENLLISQNGVPLVLLVLLEFPHNSMILTEAIFILKNISFSEQGRTIILQNQSALDLLLNSLENHLSENSELVDLCINLLSDLTFSGLLASERTIQLIVQALLFYKSHSNIVTQCLTAISKFYNSTDQLKIMIIRSDIVKLLLEEDFPEVTKVLIQRLLYHFSMDRLNYVKKTETDVPTLGELASRVVCNRKVNVPEQYLPPVLEKHLLTSKSCNVCGLAYFYHFFETIWYSTHPTVKMTLPNFIVTCSNSCLEKGKS